MMVWSLSVALAQTLPGPVDIEVVSTSSSGLGHKAYDMLAYCHNTPMAYFAPEAYDWLDEDPKLVSFRWEVAYNEATPELRAEKSMGDAVDQLRKATGQHWVVERNGAGYLLGVRQNRPNHPRPYLPVECRVDVAPGPIDIQAALRAAAQTRDECAVYGILFQPASPIMVGLGRGGPADHLSVEWRGPAGTARLEELLYTYVAGTGHSMYGFCLEEEDEVAFCEVRIYPTWLFVRTSGKDDMEKFLQSRNQTFNPCGRDAP